MFWLKNITTISIKHWNTEFTNYKKIYWDKYDNLFENKTFNVLVTKFAFIMNQLETATYTINV